MGLINKLFSLFGKQKKNDEVKDMLKDGKIYDQILEKPQEMVEIASIWDVIDTQEHTQAHHLVSVIPFDEWVSMDEILRRIWDIFQIEYKNDRSLYPYLKTMVDLGLIETGNIGGRRKWRKKDLLIKSKQEKKDKELISLTNQPRE